MRLNIQFFAEGDPEVKVPEQVEKTADPQLPKFESIEEYNKLLQSTSSKAKNELLKEIGLGSVAEIKEAVSKSSTVEELAKELDLSKAQVETLKNQLGEKSAAIKKAEDAQLLKSAGIAEEHAELFLQLVDADTSDLSREEKAKKVKIKLAKMVGVEVKIGTEKTITKEEQDKRIEAVRAAAGLK